MSRPLDGLLLRPRREAEVNSVPYGTGEEQHVLIQHSYTSLAKQLRGLKDLPLAINTIQGVSPVFRFAEVTRIANLSAGVKAFLDAAKIRNLSKLLFTLLVNLFTFWCC